jgi:hypothetical protein
VKRCCEEGHQLWRWTILLAKYRWALATGVARHLPSECAFFNTEHCGALRVLDFQPTLRTSRAIGAIGMLCDNAFTTKLAGVLENEFAISIHVIVEQNAIARLPQHLSQPRLAFS